LCAVAQVTALGRVSSEHLVGILDAPFLVTAVRVAEVDGRNDRMLFVLNAVVQTECQSSFVFQYAIRRTCE